MVTSRTALRLYIKRHYEVASIRAVGKDLLFAEMKDTPSEDDKQLYRCKPFAFGTAVGYMFQVPYGTDTLKNLPSTYANCLSRIASSGISIIAAYQLEAAKPSVEFAECKVQHFMQGDMVGKWKVIKVKKGDVEGQYNMSLSMYAADDTYTYILFNAGYARSYAAFLSSLRDQVALAQFCDLLYTTLAKAVKEGREVRDQEWSQIQEADTTLSVDWRMLREVRVGEGKEWGGL